MNASNWKSTFGATGSSLLESFTNMLNLRKKKDMAHCDSINEVLFYGADDDKRKKQIGLNNLFCIYYVIAHACRSIDMCLPTLTSDTITKCLVSVQQRNCAQIRVAIYNSDDIGNFQQLAKQGIDVKIIKSKVKLEHEFVLIDADDDRHEAMAVFGSLDYEITRVNCNRDATLLTSESKVIIALKKEFDRLWSSEDSIQCETIDNGNKANHFNN